MRLTTFRLNDLRPVQVPSMFRRGCSLHAVCFQTQAANPLPFWAWCISHFHHFCHDGTYDDSLAPVCADHAGLPLTLVPLVTVSCGLSCPSINCFHRLLAAWADSMSLLRGDRRRRASGINSTHLFDLVSMTEIGSTALLHEKDQWRITHLLTNGHHDIANS